MPSWSLPVADVVDTGRPYLLDSDSTDSPSAFVVRLRSRVPGAVAHPGGGFLVAFGTACTHMGCSLVNDKDAAVEHRPPAGSEAEHLVCGPCPCHGTTFDLTRQGLVVLGPATQNLPQLELAVDDGAPPRVRSEGWLRARDPRLDPWPILEGA